MMTAANVFWTNQTFTSMGRDTGKTLRWSRWRFHYQRRRAVRHSIGTVVVDCLAAICRRAECADSDSRCHNGSTGTWRVLHVDYMTATAKQQLMTCICCSLSPLLFRLADGTETKHVSTHIYRRHPRCGRIQLRWTTQHDTQTHVTLWIHKLWAVMPEWNEEEQ